MFESLNKFIGCFGYAWEGIKTGFQQRNFRFHTLAAIIAILMGIFFRISIFEWSLIFLVIGAVMSAELMNSAIEEVCNVMAKKLHLDYYDTWDPRNLAAGAVFIISLAALMVGIFIFIPKIILLIY